MKSAHFFQVTGIIFTIVLFLLILQRYLNPLGVVFYQAGFSILLISLLTLIFFVFLNKKTTAPLEYLPVIFSSAILSYAFLPF